MVAPSHGPPGRALRAGQLFRSTRARNRSSPARPYIARLIAFSRLIWPSTGPLLHDSVNAADTAAASDSRPDANRTNSGAPLPFALATQPASVPVDFRRLRSARSPATV